MVVSAGTASESAEQFYLLKAIKARMVSGMELHVTSP